MSALTDSVYSYDRIDRLNMFKSPLQANLFSDFNQTLRYTLVNIFNTFSCFSDDYYEMVGPWLTYFENNYGVVKFNHKMKEEMLALIKRVDISLFYTKFFARLCQNTACPHLALFTFRSIYNWSSKQNSCIIEDNITIANCPSIWCFWSNETTF